MPGQNSSFYFIAEWRIDWSACSRPGISAVAVSCCNRGLVNSYPTQPHPRGSVAVYRCIHQFQISSRAACVHRNSNSTEPVEILMGKPDLEKRKPFAFHILHFYVSEFICFLFFLSLCFPWSTVFSCFRSATQCLVFNSLQYEILSINIFSLDGWKVSNSNPSILFVHENLQNTDISGHK